MTHLFEINITLEREDLVIAGFDTSNVSDETMEAIAYDLKEHFCSFLLPELDHIVSEGYDIPERSS